MTTDVPDPSPGTSSPALERVERKLLAVATRWAEAIAANDAARIDAFVTEDWVMVSDTGIYPGNEFLALIASGELTHSAMDVVGTRVCVLGAPAALTARISTTARYRGHQFQVDDWTTDVFVRRHDRWLALTHYTAVAHASWRPACPGPALMHPLT